jgi:hypothetical protein
MPTKRQMRLTAISILNGAETTRHFAKRNGADEPRYVPSATLTAQLPLANA